MSSKEFAEDYVKLSSLCQEKEYLDVLSSVTLKEGFNCLDIGCGTGNCTKLLAQRVGSTGNVIGIEPSIHSLDVAKKENGMPSITYILGKSVDIPPGEYDFVISSNVLHWVKEKLETFQLVYKFLKDGGLFGILLLTESPKDITTLLQLCSPEVQNLARESFYPITPIALKEMVEKVGFEMIFMKEETADIPFESVDQFLRWVDASIPGKRNVRDLYYVNEEKLKNKLPRFELGEGFLCHQVKLILKKQTKTV